MTYSSISTSVQNIVVQCSVRAVSWKLFQKTVCAFVCRKKIRWFCDELNMLVPFCDSDTDKVNTLRWTTTFLRYAINKHGETLKHVSLWLS